MVDCKLCKYRGYSAVGKDRADTHDDHVCLANVREQKLNPITGKMEYIAVNQYGREYFVDIPYKYCVDINKDGKCVQFAKKEG